MSIDYNQLFQIFFEESAELLAEMEEALLSIDLQTVDLEKINQTFRVMHTLKGNSSIINFSEITEFLHSTETYLDQIRHKEISLDEEDLKLLLDAIDTLRVIFKNKKEQKTLDITHLSELQTAFLKRLSATQGIIYKGEPPTQPKTSEASKSTPSVPTETKAEAQTDSSTQGVPAALVPPSPPGPPQIPTTQDKATTIRIGTEKIDTLINLVGELVISQSMLSQMIGTLDLGRARQQAIEERLQLLQLKYRQLQDTVLSIRMLPLKTAFGRFQRTVHDLSNQLGKKVDFKIRGEDTEIDKQIIEKIADPLIHLIRNAIDHGIETPEKRIQKGKPPIGKLLLNAYELAGKVIIEVEDDGQGLDREKILKKAVDQKLIEDPSALNEQQILDLIFVPGFSTAEVVSAVSGRGVGMDVVQKNIQELGGTIAIETVSGKGSKFGLHLPLSISIMDCQLIKVLDQIAIIPLMNILTITIIDRAQLEFKENEPSLYYLNNEYIPLIDLRKVLWNQIIPLESLAQDCMIVVEINQKRYGLIFDEVINQQQIFIKNLEDTYKKIVGLLGVTILGDGSVAPILDVAALISINQSYHLKYHEARDRRSRGLPSLNLEKPQITNLMWKNNTFQALSFKVNNGTYALDISNVLEIQLCDKITPLPYLEPYIEGVTNVRGYIYPIINLIKLFQLHEHVTTVDPKSTQPAPLQQENQQIIIVGLEGSPQRFAILVNAMGDTLTVKEEELKPLPEVEDFPSRPFILGYIHKNEKTITLLDAMNLNILMMRQESSGNGNLSAVV